MAAFFITSLVGYNSKAPIFGLQRQLEIAQKFVYQIGCVVWGGFQLTTMSLLIRSCCYVELELVYVKAGFLK